MKFQKLHKFHRSKISIDEEIESIASYCVHNEINHFLNPVLALEQELQFMSDPRNINTDQVKIFLQIPLKEHGLFLKQYIYEWKRVHKIVFLRPITPSLNEFNEILLTMNQKAISQLPRGYRTELNVFNAVMNMEPEGLEISALKYLKSPTTVDFALTYLNQIAIWGED